MPKVLVLFYSRTGDTAALADAVAEGASSVKFTEVEVRRVEAPSPVGESDNGAAQGAARASLAKKYRVLESVESLAQYDAIIVGSPVRQGAMCEELKRTLDQAEALGKRGTLLDKVGSAFAPASAPGDAGDANIMSMLMAMMRLGMILVPPASTGAEALVAARAQGARVAKVAEWVRHAKSHEAHGHHH